MPGSFFGRSLLILLLPLLLLQVVSAFVFYNRHWEDVGRRLALGLGGEISILVEAIESYPDGVERDWIMAQAHQNLSIISSWQEGGRLPDSPPHRSFGAVDWTLERVLPERLAYPFHFDTTRGKQVIIRVQLADGVLEVTVPRKRLFSSTIYIFIAWMVGTSLILLSIAIFFLRRQIRPIRRLAHAAESFGKGMQVVNFKPEGAREVRQAASAFLRMRERIQRQITQRTEMLAGVSHDLRTPLTRMKLQLAMLPKSDYAAGLRGDVSEMEKMVDGYLAFARGEGSEVPVPASLQAILEEVVEDARRNGADVVLESAVDVQITIRPHAIKRALTNLIDNASRHSYEVYVAAIKKGGTVEITVDDNGPGIPEAHRESVFKPFFRIDPSRNVETGGVGLGLTIARDVVRNHGGDLLLKESAAGGLRALIRLPM
ncbi:MAG: Osmolarity sensor protein EnvZ [Alphaproteobacteria bacterium MarineAlpha9_Bin7]|nr:MAG: Osmolarity sensor protein EnvZ [Alphaproteobacteria bacterium MarineAlpha9_Bin7]